MPITVVEVTQIREFDYSTENLTGNAIYDVKFTTDTVDEYADYVTKNNLCLTATQPGGAGDVTDTIPQFGDQLQNATGTVFFKTYVRNVSPRIYKAQNNWWRVTVNYQPADSQEDADAILDDDPENTTPTFAWGNGETQRSIYIDKTPAAQGGPLPIVVSSGDGLTTLPKIDEAFLTLTVNRRTGAGDFEPLVAIDLINTTNDAVLTLRGTPFPLGTVRLRKWTAVERTAIVQKEGLPPVQTQYFDETRVYHIKKDGWLAEIFDQGLNEFVETGSPTGRQPIRRFGQLVKEPQPLNGRGLVIYDEKGALINDPVDLPIAGGQPGVRAFGGGAAKRAAMLLFTFYPPADLSVLGDN